MRLLGLMSGSSLDGLDMACVEFEWLSKPEAINWKLHACGGETWPPELKEQLSRIKAGMPQQIESLDVLFCKETARIVLHFLKHKEGPIDYIASHGHTIYHYPDQNKTLQIGNGKLLCQLLQIPVIADFRSQDIVLGGQGAPLAPIVEKYIFPGFDYYLNLGGIANLTLAENWTAFDVCPCNQILNHYAEQVKLPYDDQGRIANSGSLNPSLLDQLNQWQYYKLTGPKSLDNNQLRDYFIPLIDDLGLNIPDVLCSFCHHIAFQLANAIHQNQKIKTQSPRRMFITGGGVYNRFLMQLLEERLHSLDILVIQPSDDIIQYKESILMALMGFLRVEAIPNCLASVTGAAHDHIAGYIFSNTEHSK